MNTTIRLNAYAALAAGFMPAIAGADITGEDGLNIVVTPDNPASIDFGPGFGHVFEFTMNSDAGSYSNSSQNSYSSYYVRSSNVNRTNMFNFRGDAPWTRGSMIAYSTGYPSRLGQDFNVEENPDHYGGWNDIGGGYFQFVYYSNYYRRTQTYYGGSNQTSWYNSGGFGDWARGRRGFLGLRFTENGADFYHAWFDVSVDRSGFPMTIHGWGLNRSANESILTGQIPAPSGAALAILATGAAGIRRSRRA